MRSGAPVHGPRAESTGWCNLLCNNQVKCSHQSSPRVLNCAFIERLKEVPMCFTLKKHASPPSVGRSLWPTKTGAPRGGDCASFATPPALAGLLWPTKTGASHGVIAFSFWRLGVFVMLFLGMPFMKQCSSKTKSK